MENEQSQHQVKHLKHQYEQLMKILQKRQVTYSELEHKHSALNKALNDGCTDQEVKKRVENSYAMYAGEQQILSTTLMKVQGIDKDLERLDCELNT